MRECGGGEWGGNIWDCCRGGYLLAGSRDAAPSRLPLMDLTAPSKLLGICRVNESVWLSSAAALSTDCLERLGVTCLVSAAPELPLLPLSAQVDRLNLDLLDNKDAFIYPHLHLVADLIHKVGLSGGRSLVHCVAGVSRSASLCLGYLVKHQHLSLSDAFQYLKKQRPCIRPNTSFFSQLIEFEKEVRGTTSVSMVFNPAAGGLIPDVYLSDYHNTLSYQQRTCGAK